MLIFHSRLFRMMRKHSMALMGAGLLILVLMTTAVVATQGENTPDLLDTRAAAQKSIAFTRTQELAEYFQQLDYQWPPSDFSKVPSVTLDAFPEDFSAATTTQERKSLFLRSLLPIVLLENRRLREQHNLAKLILENDLPDKGSPTRKWLDGVAKEMRIRGDLTKESVQQRLLNRLDEIPPALALAQAAIESGWGTSRFASEGNSLFGQWTYNADKGLEPTERDADATHFVSAFPNLQASVRAYMRNLNTSRAYREFRDERARMRADGEDLSATELAQHLRRYSQRGMEYVQELQKIIASRTLSALELLPATMDNLVALFPPQPKEPS